MCGLTKELVSKPNHVCLLSHLIKSVDCTSFVQENSSGCSCTDVVLVKLFIVTDICCFTICNGIQ